MDEKTAATGSAVCNEGAAAGGAVGLLKNGLGADGKGRGIVGDLLCRDTGWDAGSGCGL